MYLLCGCVHKCVVDVVADVWVDGCGMCVGVIVMCVCDVDLGVHMYGGEFGCHVGVCKCAMLI